MLGRLEKVDLRSVWLNESSGFTPWLAEAANLQILAETLNIDLELVEQEKSVGPFRADILCKDVSNDSWVVIENQLEKTDHTHLGQILAYASGLQAVTIIWIAERFTNEHRATLDWLNEITDERFQFFGLEIELWKIGNSNPAPKFNIISKPNDWSKSIKENARILSEADLSETKLMQREYWTQLRELLVSSHSPLKPQKPLPQHWYNFKLGRSYFCLFAAVNTKDNRLTVGLSMTGPYSKEHYRLLCEDIVKIEEECGKALVWKELKEGIESKIETVLENADPSDRSDWPRQHEWIKNALEKFYAVFRHRIRELDAGIDNGRK